MSASRFGLEGEKDVVVTNDRHRGELERAEVHYDRLKDLERLLIDADKLQNEAGTQFKDEFRSFKDVVISRKKNVKSYVVRTEGIHADMWKEESNMLETKKALLSKAFTTLSDQSSGASQRKRAIIDELKRGHDFHWNGEFNSLAVEWEVVAKRLAKIKSMERVFFRDGRLSVFASSANT